MNEKLLFLWTGMNPTHRVLVTGFEPFGGNNTNVSQTVALRLSGVRTVLCPWSDTSVEVEVDVAILPVDELGADATAQRIRNGEQWDAILHLGLCESCLEPRVERLAHDWLSMRIPDNRGRQVSGRPIDGEGHRGTWLDVSIWDPERFPVNFDVSYDAGAYLCNETYHATLKAQCMHEHEAVMPSPTLFLHLPSEKRMAVQTAIDFVDVCLGYMLRPYPRPPTHVVAACLSQADRVLVTQRNMTESDGGLWEFPGGKCEPGEDWSQALIREMKEELSLDVVPRFPLGSWYREREDSAFLIHLVSTQLVGEFSDMRLSVHQATQWFSNSNSTPFEWAGRDGEMAAFLLEAFRPMS
jgi:pyrrolidone-carboxylate peptidase/8-oxo-dGTP pyrophosphatase MutT (NUDIX family)